ncbi:MAG: hypothetical protein IPH78_15260 [Bacteroidetes bacterium]|nr:hypothetical protein [Bacteroidota bacterium]
MTLPKPPDVQLPKAIANMGYNADEVKACRSLPTKLPPAAKSQGCAHIKPLPTDRYILLLSASAF